MGSVGKNESFSKNTPTVAKALTSEHLLIRIRIANAIGVVALLMTSLSMILQAVMDAPGKWRMSLPGLLFVIPLALIRYGHHSLGRFILILFSMSMIPIYSWLYGPDCGLKYMIPAAALIPFTIFVAEELGLILTSLGLVALAIVAIELLSAYAPLPAIPLEPEFRSVMESFYLGFSFLVAGLQAWLLHSLENKRAQKLLHLAASQQHQARLMALGELAANIAHEVRNPLAIIHGKAVQLRRKVTESIVPSEDVAKVCSQVIEASERITRTTSSMLRLGRMEPSNNKEVIDIGRIAQSVGDLCSEHARANGCLFSLSLPEQATMVVGCESELLQVVLNLVNNALYAVRGRPDSSVEIRVECHGGLASLVVEDNGPGIPKGLRAKIMEPFFSTKPEGEGTGLGLSISRAIAVDHGGHLVLDESKVGARFRLDLPMASGHVDLLKKDA